MRSWFERRKPLGMRRQKVFLPVGSGASGRPQFEQWGDAETGRVVNGDTLDGAVEHAFLLFGDLPHNSSKGTDIDTIGPMTIKPELDTAGLNSGVLGSRTIRAAAGMLYTNTASTK